MTTPVAPNSSTDFQAKSKGKHRTKKHSVSREKLSYTSPSHTGSIFAEIHIGPFVYSPDYYKSMGQQSSGTSHSSGTVYGP